MAIISFALYLSDQTDRTKEKKTLQDQISKLKALEKGRHIQKLRAFMIKSHTWALGDSGRCVDIPEGSRLIELNDGSYLILRNIILDAGFSGKAQGNMQVELIKDRG